MYLTNEYHDIIELFNEVYNKRIEHNFGNLIATVLHIDDILKNKIASNRAKDKIDVIELKKLKQI